MLREPRLTAPLLLLGTITYIALGGGSVAAGIGPPEGTCQFLENSQFPAAIAAAPDGRIFYNELYAGSVRVIHVIGGVATLQETPFVTIPDVNGTLEMGLLGIAVDPDWNSTPWLYVFYTAKAPPADENRIVRFWAAGSTAGPSEVVLAGIEANTSHNGGMIKFGLDGKLYVSIGDALNGSAAQSNASLNGKILRVEKDGSIPADNPDPSSRIYTLGHRSVFGLSFNPWNGVPYITENGPDTDDEVNMLLPGGNYGWPLAVGHANNSSLVDPLLAINPVTAPTGLVFDTTRFPQGDRVDLYYGNFNTGLIMRLVLDGPSYTNISTIEVALDMRANVLALERIPGGPILITTVSTIFTFDPQRSSFLEPVPALVVSRESSFPGFPIYFDASTSFDPDGDAPLSVHIDFGDGMALAAAAAYHAYSAAGEYRVVVLVFDACRYGASTESTVRVLDPSQNAQPTAKFSVSPTTAYPLDLVEFDGRASSDLEGGEIIRWRWDFGDGVTAEGPRVAHVFSTEGDFRVILAVVDELGAMANAEFGMTILHRNVPPKAVIEVEEATAHVGAAAVFDASSSSDPEGPLTAYEWDFGDGVTASGVRVRHFFVADGEHLVRLKVIDTNGAANTTTMLFHVQPAAVERPGWIVGVVAVVVSASVVIAAAGRRP